MALRVLSYDFNDVTDVGTWAPEDPFNIDEWLNVTVGDDSGGSNYQVHLCTPVSIRHIRNKRHCFMIDSWAGTSTLERELNAFVERIEAETTDNVIHTLARHWQWEYGEVPRVAT